MGIPTVHLCNLAPIAETVGSKRIYQASSIVHPVGCLGLTPEQELAFRVDLLKKALSKLQQ